MSSTSITTTNDKPSSRVQSASKQEATVESTNRPPSGAQKTAADTSTASLITATGAGVSPGAPAAGHEEPNLEAVEALIRPPSANTSTTNQSGLASTAAQVDSTPDANIIRASSSRPSSATQGTDELSSHGYSIATTHVRPPSASQTSTAAAPTGSRPPSATPATTAPTGSRPPSATPATTAPTGSRPPSATPAPTGSRPPSATPAPTGSRPPSASQKSNHVNAAPIDSRTSTASQKTDTTSVNELNSITPRAGSRPPSANQKQQVEPTIDNSTTVEPSTNSGVLDPNTTQPIIGRPPSAAKKSSTDETTTALPSDENKAVEATPTSPRIGSAAKNQPASTTTENNS